MSYQTSQSDGVATPIPTFQRLLLATDFSPASQAAFDTALAFCAPLRATLLLLHVFEYADAVPPDGDQLFEQNTLYDQACTRIEALRKSAQDAGIPCETAIQAGGPVTAILEAIQSKHIDLAILGTNALHGFERLIFGSVAEDVLRKSPCPVLTVGPRNQTPHDFPGTSPAAPILFATDFDSHTIPAIRYAASLSSATGAPLHCLHVLPRSIEVGSHSPANDSAVPRIVTEALQQLAAESGTAAATPVCAVAYGSEISSAVVHYATETNARLIVLGVRQKSMMASHIPAHIAYRIVTEAPCPVLTMAFVQHKHTSMAACL
jgi:nucleotide-binding universal stress UspA family protein